MTGSIYTIGHSRHLIARFVDHLKRHAISAIADVRSQPYSRMNPQYNREALRAKLQHAGISYVFLGKELGARDDRHLVGACLDDAALGGLARELRRGPVRYGNPALRWVLAGQRDDGRYLLGRKLWRCAGPVILHEHPDDELFEILV